MTVGPVLSIPWGLTICCIIVVAVLMIISEIWWRVMKHFPEDDLSWEDESRFVLKNDDD